MGAAALSKQAGNGLPHELFPMALEQPEAPNIHTFNDEHKLFKIRLADDDGKRSSASMLIDKMYSWRGYGSGAALNASPNRITLVASHDGRTLGTVSLGIDSPIGLMVDEMYKEEADELRRAGRKLCEVGKLAVDHVVRSKRVLASLFHIVFIYAYRIHVCSDFLIEINPRHVAFYKKMLGFEEFGGLKICPRVDAPARLMRLDLDHMRDQISKYGGHATTYAAEKSLYPYFFSPAEESGITQRLITIH